MEISNLAIDADAIENGQWMPCPDLGDDISVLVRGIDNMDYRNLQQKLLDRARRQYPDGIPPAATDKLQNELIIKTIWLGVKGLTENKQAITFTTEWAEHTVADPRMRRLRNAVLNASTTVGVQKAAATEEISGN